MKNVRINGKWDILLPEHRADRPEWHTPPYWEEERIESLHEYLGPKDTMLYVGAEEGDMAGLIASWGVQMVLFEPNERVWPNIKAIWEANNLALPWCFTGFASNCNVGMALSKGFPKAADGPIIGDHGFKELIDPGDIPQIKIDTLSSMLAYDPGIIPTAISLDVEGSEWRVLEGAVDTIKKYKPKLWVSIHPEFMFRMYDEYQFELRKWIKDLGYEEYFLDYQHELHVMYLPK